MVYNSRIQMFLIKICIYKCIWKTYLQEKVYLQIHFYKCCPNDIYPLMFILSPRKQTVLITKYCIIMKNYCRTSWNWKYNNSMVKERSSFKTCRSSPGWLLYITAGYVSSLLLALISSLDTKVSRNIELMKYRSYIIYEQ